MHFVDINNLIKYIKGYNLSDSKCRDCNSNTHLILQNFSRDNPESGMFFRIVCNSCSWFDKSSHKEWWSEQLINNEDTDDKIELNWLDIEEEVCHNQSIVESMHGNSCDIGLLMVVVQDIVEKKIKEKLNINKGEK